MPLWVLTARPTLPLYGELAAAAAQQGHQLEVVDAAAAVAQAWPPRVWAGGRPAEGVGAVLGRVGNWRPDTALAALEALEAAGVPSLNPARAIRVGRDHWRTVQVLSLAGIPCPPTVCGGDPEQVAAAARALGFPCVVKQRHSRQGLGVIKCDGEPVLAAVLDALWRAGDEVVVQRFCPPGGVSVRVLVVDGQVLGATRHTAAAGEFRSNAARGARVEALALPAELAALAVGAAAAAGLGLCGVDLLPDGERWVVGEINPTPGWAHFARATGLPVAAAVVRALARLAEGR